ncbi:MAG: hypothetical protein ACI81L_001164 [Verrucomicrobiales bacterium]|jgi:hypothetical protein
MGTRIVAVWSSMVCEPSSKQEISGRALDVLGYGPISPAKIGNITIEPATVRIGEKVKLEFVIENPSELSCGALVDLCVHFVKANGTRGPKVFKGAELTLEAGDSATVRKTISVAQHTTRKHYVGEQPVDILINGSAHRAGSFTIEQ